MRTTLKKVCVVVKKCKELENFLETSIRLEDTYHSIRFEKKNFREKLLEKYVPPSLYLHAPITEEQKMGANSFSGKGNNVYNNLQKIFPLRNFANIEKVSTIYWRQEIAENEVHDKILVGKRL